jgi:hypothetical protein
MKYTDSTSSHVWELVALFAVFERGGICTKQDLYDLIHEVRQANIRACPSESLFPTPYILTDSRRPIIEDILEMLHKNGLTSLDSTQMLERVQHTIEISESIVQMLLL